MESITEISKMEDVIFDEEEEVLQKISNTKKLDKKWKKLRHYRMKKSKR